MEKTYKIGYIDENDQTVKQFIRNLRPYGIEVIGYDFTKGMTPEALMEQVYASDIDLLMIDYKLAESNIVGFDGDQIEHLIYTNRPQFPHIIFTSDTQQAENHVEDWKIIFDKADVLFTDEDKDKTNRFINMLTRSIDQYRNLVDSKKNRLSALLSKGHEAGLNAAEKSEVLSLQDELNNLDSTKVIEVPKQMVSIENLESLEKTRKEAEEFLQSLIEKAR